MIIIQRQVSIYSIKAIDLQFVHLDPLKNKQAMSNVLFDINNDL
jgi:hypothetical protein